MTEHNKAHNPTKERPLDEVMASAIRAALRAAGYQAYGQEGLKPYGALVSKLDMAQTALSSYVRAFRRPSYEAVLAIEDACGLRRGWIYEKAGLVVPEGDKPDVAQLIRTCEKLSPRQQEAMYVLFQGLVDDEDD